MHYQFSQLFGSAEMFQFVLSRYLFHGAVPINAPLSQQIDGIVGQTNILFNPPFSVGHGNAIY